ncbi:MAG: phosphoglycerate kinase, partial [Sphingomonadales bacterium]|nr:phosphoglycerate kinase [Sphingomonadales bacterium]
MSFKTIDDLGDITGKTALVRVDLNVPMQDGKVTDNTRLDAIKPTVDSLIGKGAKVLLLAHFGRPKGQVVPEMSLKPVVLFLAEVLGRPVGFGTVGETLPDADVI